MRNVDKLNQISEIVRKVLSADFRNIDIVSVEVLNDVDFDGDAILKIEVVFKGTPKTVETSGLSAAVRLIRPKLTEINEDAFPLLSFISASEVRKKATSATA